MLSPIRSTINSMDYNKYQSLNGDMGLPGYNSIPVSCSRAIREMTPSNLLPMPDMMTINAINMLLNISNSQQKTSDDSMRTNELLQLLHTSDRYKTEMCRSFKENGRCRYGSKCLFAHGPNEMRPLGRHPKYKTERCRTYHEKGFCTYGPRCNFVHEDQETQTAPKPLKAITSADFQLCSMLPPYNLLTLVPLSQIIGSDSAINRHGDVSLNNSVTSLSDTSQAGSKAGSRAESPESMTSDQLVQQLSRLFSFNAS